ncbi:MAG: (S)-ureidoglycine aminohydrolase [Spirochaetes bacterium]|nr:(S)-ureidoglycine aminohydrolase [Spirochaetota bacterium]
MHTALTRSRITTDHALITPESHVLLSPPGWSKSNVVYFISPQMGANFTMFLGVFEAGGEVKRNLGDNEILGYVLEGEGELQSKGKNSLQAGSFFFLPPGTNFSLTAKQQSRVLFFEKMYEPLAGVNLPAEIISHESKINKEAFLGDPGALLQTLMPMGAEFDMGVNIFEFVPGGTLPNVENHYMEHGLYVLQGQGVYRLSESWYPVQKDDAIWMAPYCLQWFVASGKQNTKYIYYKDMNRPPLV